MRLSSNTCGRDHKASCLSSKAAVVQQGYSAYDCGSLGNKLKPTTIVLQLDPDARLMIVADSTTISAFMAMAASELTLKSRMLDKLAKEIDGNLRGEAVRMSGAILLGSENDKLWHL